MSCALCGDEKSPHPFSDDKSLCKNCHALWLRFFANSISILQAEFLLKNVSAFAIGEKIRFSLMRKKADGFPLGRPRQVDYSKAKALRHEGKTFEQIARALGCSKAGVHRILKASTP
jgi:hypothetical protein